MVGGFREYYSGAKGVEGEVARNFLKFPKLKFT